MYVLPHAYPFVSALGRIHLNFVLMKIYIKNHQEDNGKTNVIGNLLMDTFLYRKNILLRKFYQQVKLILINCTIDHWKCHDLIDFIFIHFLKVSLLHQMELKDEQSPFYWLSCRKVEQKILKHFFLLLLIKRTINRMPFCSIYSKLHKWPNSLNSEKQTINHIFSNHATNKKSCCIIISGGKQYIYQKCFKLHNLKTFYLKKKYWLIFYKSLANSHTIFFNFFSKHCTCSFILNVIS